MFTDPAWIRIKGDSGLPAPLRLTWPADERRDFMAAVVGAIS